MRMLAILFVLLMFHGAEGEQKNRTLRRSDGTTAGTITRSGNMETWRNSRGETVYTGNRHRRGWEYRNSRGEREWSED